MHQIEFRINPNWNFQFESIHKSSEKSQFLVGSSRSTRNEKAFDIQSGDS